MFKYAQAEELQIGDVAPDFELLDQNGTTHSLKNYQGQWVILYFYPKNDTPGCTTEACEFRDDYKDFLSLDQSIFWVVTPPALLIRTIDGAIMINTTINVS